MLLSHAGDSSTMQGEQIETLVQELNKDDGKTIKKNLEDAVNIEKTTPQKDNTKNWVTKVFTKINNKDSTSEDLPVNDCSQRPSNELKKTDEVKNEVVAINAGVDNKHL